MEYTTEYTRIFTDAAGETHFETVEVPMTFADFAPPATPLAVATFTPATRFTFIAAHSGWNGDWHPTPARQILFYLKGVAEVTTSDGEVRRFGPGSALLVEDTTGKGHTSRVVSEDEVLNAVVQLPD